MQFLVQVTGAELPANEVAEQLRDFAQGLIDTADAAQVTVELGSEADVASNTARGEECSCGDSDVYDGYAECSVHPPSSGDGTRFVLDRRAWVPRAIDAETLPTWDPRVLGNEDEVEGVVAEAVAAGVIASPVRVTQPGYEYSDDNGGGSYQWVLHVPFTDTNGGERSLRLAGLIHKQGKIVQRGEVGMAAVWAILDEAVVEWNQVLNDLGAYVTTMVNTLCSATERGRSCVYREGHDVSVFPHRFE